MSKQRAKSGAKDEKIISRCYCRKFTVMAGGAEKTFETGVIDAYKIYAFQKLARQRRIIITHHRLSGPPKEPLLKLIFSVLLTVMSHCGILLGKLENKWAVARKAGMSKVRYLRAYLVFFGALNILTSFSVPLLFGNEVLWSPRNLPTDLMVASLYFPMGIIMLQVAKTPEKHKAFIDFVIISSVLHSVIMIVSAQSALHIALDAVFMATMGAVPLFVYPWGLKRFLQY